MKPILVVFTGLMAAGCATRAENISAAYVSPIQYQSFTELEFEQAKGVYIMIASNL